ncbi:B-cell CLL/lymphoma 6 member B protein [Polypterus senegalus]|uniref:B-cell CLL/lymphoma 6 member B protein n=1 Tax=Polypterus senegalus TaxID=55291 RepID=UPI001963CF62|nr:B-cell CLL/lymphoma 6 member B protein [Polypterus senegalus]XP_039602895.1 B-cell CLL/lymphoma 6 member B protein [Polypterus senegalus]
MSVLGTAAVETYLKEMSGAVTAAEGYLEKCHSSTAIGGYTKRYHHDDSLPVEGYVKEFTRHSNDVLLNLNELRHREILTDATLLVGNTQLLAHRAVLIACSGFFYSLFSHCGSAGLSVLTLPDTLDVRGVTLLLEFMYTSRLPLTLDTVGAVLAAATYLQMEHVADACRAFIQSRATTHPRSRLLDYTSSVLCASAHSEVLLGRGVYCWGPSLTPLSSRVPTSSVPSKTLLQNSSTIKNLGENMPLSEIQGTAQQEALHFQNPVKALRVLESQTSEATMDHSGFKDIAKKHDGQQESCQAHQDEVKIEAEASGSRELSVSPLPTPDSPSRSGCHPNSPSEASICGSQAAQTEARPNPDPKACNWKKYKYIVLNPLCRRSAVKDEEEEEEEEEEEGDKKLEGDDPELGHTPRSPERCPSSDHSAQEAGDKDEMSQSVRLIPRYVQCNVCLQSFEQVSQLFHHIMASHPEEDLPDLSSAASRCTSGVAMTCTICQGHFTKQDAQHRHLLQCNGDNDQPKCDSCCSSFCHSSSPSTQKIVHAGEKPYRCSICGAQFNRPANLKTHSRIHSGEKPYRCDTCGARFVQVAHLRAHVLIHTGEKPYPCETCGTRFRHLQTLKSHIRIHTGEKPYHCEKCDLHFRHKSQLRLHLRQKHGAVTNTKIRYKVLSDPYRAAIVSC